MKHLNWGKNNFWIWLFVLFWLGCWFFSKGLIPSSPNDSTVPVVYAPLTAAEQILFGYRLNINQLDEADWELLPGIGPVTAKRIMAFQKEHGPFKNFQSLQNIPRLGPKRLLRLASYF